MFKIPNLFESDKKREARIPEEMEPVIAADNVLDDPDSTEDSLIVAKKVLDDTPELYKGYTEERLAERPEE